jgi:hypothetical protein
MQRGMKLIAIIVILVAIIIATIILIIYYVGVKVFTIEEAQLIVSLIKSPRPCYNRYCHP